MKLEDRLKSLLTGLTVIAAGAALLGVNTQNDFLQEHVWLRYSLAILLVIIFLFILFLGPLLKFYRETVMRRRDLSDVVVSKKTSILSIHAGGQKANYFQKAHFSDIKDGAYIVYLVSDPNNATSYINPATLQLANCSAQFDSCNKVLKLYFVNKIASLNKTKSLYRVEKYFYFSAELINCFTDAEADSWDITTFNYTKEYELNIHFPPGRRINNNVHIFRKTEGKEIKVDAAKPVIVNKGDRDSIYLMITNFDKLDKYVIRWEYLKTELVEDLPAFSAANM